MKDLRAKLLKTQKEKIALLEEKLCKQSEDEQVEDNRHDGNGGAALTEANAERAKLAERCKLLEKRLTKVCCAASEARCKRDHDHDEQCKKINHLQTMLSNSNSMGSASNGGDLERERDSYKTRCAKLEKSLTDVCCAAANQRTQKEQD